ncbi:MAG: hypothetical protein EZS28_014904 [Streblomastix strix]|uniref:Uncharacterized protein n=1 Tax=Streblomastix strix TaxID=222440 RepID=A0A5J4W411_9EUKA|nr:MAG: hypothetical protein EZS28_014904 [Streblomastix strix]
MQNFVLFLDYKMSNVYIDEALLNSAGLSEFSELYVYIHEREPKPIVDGIANQIIVGPQYPQDQVKDNDNKLSVQPPPSTPITPIVVAAEVITVSLYTLTQPLLPYNIGDGGIKFYKLRNKVVYNIGLYLREDFMGFVFTSFPEELLPFSKHALVLGDYGGHKRNIMGYISEKGPYIGSSIGSVDQITPIKGNIHIAIAGVYYTDYEPLKRATSNVNGDGNINIVDDWQVNSIIDGMKSMLWVQDTDQKQTEAIGDGVQPYYPSQPDSLFNYFNNNTKLVNNKRFGPLREAYFVKEGPICIFNFQAEVSSQHVNNVFKVFQAVDSDLQPILTKFFPIKTSYTSFAGIIQINGNDTPDVVVNQGFGYYPMDLCDFSGSYLIDPQLQESNQNNITSNDQPISHIDSVIMQHDILPPMPIPPSVFPQYTVTEVSRDQILTLAYTPYGLDAFKIYIIDYSVNKLVMFNMHLRQKGFIDTKQYLLTMSQSLDPKRTLLFPVMILYDFNTDPIQDIPSAYLTVADTDNPARWYIHIQSQLKVDNLSDSDHDVTQIQNSFLSIVLTANVQFDKKFEGFEEYYKGGTILFIGQKSASQVIREYTIYHRGRTIDGTLWNDSTTEQFIYNTIKPRNEKNNRKHIHSLQENIHKYDRYACGTYETIREIEEAIKDNVSIPYIISMRFRLSVPLDDILVFSGFTDYPNSLFGYLKIKFKINPNAFVFAQMNTIISMAKYYTMNKTDLKAIGPDKLKNIDLIFYSWSLGYQYTKKLVEEFDVCNTPVTLSIKNYIVTEVTANMSGYKATDECLQRVREFYANKSFVVPSQRVEAWSFPTSATTIGIGTSQNIPLSHVIDLCLLFPKDARATICYENPCYHNMQVTTC